MFNKSAVLKGLIAIFLIIVILWLAYKVLILG
jgi:hypothetical protein